VGGYLRDFLRPRNGDAAAIVHNEAGRSPRRDVGEGLGGFGRLEQLPDSHRTSPLPSAVSRFFSMMYVRSELLSSILANALVHLKQMTLAS
jgi:hypothetical protein